MNKSAVFIDRSNSGFLQCTGASRLDLINRMSTQAVKDLPPGSGAATILTTDIGRVIDRIIMYADTETAYMLTSEGNGETIARYLSRFVFFNDDFHLRDLSSEITLLGIYGANAANQLQAAGFPETDFPLHHWRAASIAGVPVRLHRTDPLDGDGFLLSVPVTEREMMKSCLQNAGMEEIDEARLEYLRIQAGQPRLGHELSNDYIPLELNLWEDISFNKGCYIGQEIIARMESRGKLAKKLVRLQLDEAAEAGSELRANDKKAGRLTSVAAGPDGIIGLGIIKTALLQENSRFTAGSATAVLLDIEADQ